MNDPAACDGDVFKTGKPICLLDARSGDAEAWVNMVAKESGQRVDWHYSRGIAQVRYLGDRLRVRLAVHRLRNLLKGTVLRIVEDEGGEPGIYRAGDEVPEGTLAVSTTSGHNEYLCAE